VQSLGHAGDPTSVRIALRVLERQGLAERRKVPKPGTPGFDEWRLREVAS
jgi:DNA-binding GntR family transcriptional regulator